MSRLWLIVVLAIAWNTGFSEAFYIKDYNISITINDDASFTVDERIHVNFTDDRRGIIRSIPFAKNVDYNYKGEKAIRSVYGGTYSILFEDVDVPDHPFTTYEEGGELKIRIGDPDIYVFGDMHYHIKYTVYGAMLEFEDYAEFYWNLIGNEWPVRIEKVTFDVTYPGNEKLSQDDYHIFTGYEGNTESHSAFSLGNGKIAGSSTDVLQPGEGMTIGIRWPKNLFKTLDIPIEKMAHSFYINELEADLNVKNDGSMEVSELITFQPVESMNSFVRVLPIPPQKGISDKTIYPYIDELYVTVYGMSPKNFRAYLTGEMYQPIITVIPNTPFTTEQTIKFTYNALGAIGQKENGQELHWNMNSGYQNEPIQSVKVSIEGLEGKSAGELSFYKPYGTLSKRFDIEKTSDKWIIKSNHRIMSGGFSDFVLPLSETAVNLDKLPLKVYSKEFYVSHFDKTFNLSKNGEIQVSESYFPKYRYGNNSFSTKIKTGYLRPKYQFPLFNGLNILGRKDRFYYDILNTEGLEQRGPTYPYANFYAKDDVQQEIADNPSFSYNLAGYVKKERGKRVLKLPIWLPNDEPFDNGRAVLKWENNDKAIKARLVDYRGNTIREIPESSDSLVVFVNGSNLSSTPIYLEADLPSGVVGSSLSTAFGLFLTNNMAIVYMLGIALFLALLWLLIGKDKIDHIIARFYPPQEMTPAEAGFIYDGKLHSKDLVSLIYFWAAKGIIKIREFEGKKKKPDYELIKLNDLPKSARKYEEIMFDGLFSGRDKVKISSLKNNFYITYNQAKDAFKVFEKKAGYYARGTRGVGSILKVIGIIILFFSIGFLIFGFVERDFSIGIPIFLTGLFTYMFGRIMPRLKKKSAATLSELLGFREFIRTAEVGKLQTLVDEQPEYFGMTLPFAIVMGEGDDWAERFDSLMTAPPDYYEGYNRSDFSTSLFTHDLINSMRHMRQTMRSTPASSGGGGFKISSSGSSWSGGSSFSSGGGFSGGGFGGGGGSSW
jgi:uncharacterized membrane protein YgcG